MMGTKSRKSPIEKSNRTSRSDVQNGVNPPLKWMPTKPAACAKAMSRSNWSPTITSVQPTSRSSRYNDGDLAPYTTRSTWSAKA